MFPGIGTALNISTIIIGSLIGIFVGKKLNEKLRNLITDVLGCITVISAADALTAYWDPSLTKSLPNGGAILVVIFSLLAGALIGNQIGKTMDEHDKLMLEKSSHQALEFSPSGSSVEWNNPDSGNHGYITPTKTFRESGQYCREYQQEIVVGGEKHKAFGKACRQADGHWKIIQ